MEKVVVLGPWRVARPGVMLRAWQLRKRQRASLAMRMLGETLLQPTQPVGLLRVVQGSMPSCGNKLYRDEHFMNLPGNKGGLPNSMPPDSLSPQKPGCKNRD